MGKTEPGRKKFRGIIIFFKTIGILLLGLGIVACLGAVGLLSTYISEAMNFKIDDYQLNITSYIYAQNEKGEYEEIEHLGADLNSMWVTDEQIPKQLKEAFIAIEDERFYKHFGVDIKRTFGAVVNYVVKGQSDYGGSTITQQLVKNITGDKTNKPDRKVREMFRAIALETQLNKKQVLEYYLNIIFLGGSCNGVQAAAYNYFGKDVSELTLAEAASIAGITQLPTKYNPYISPEENKYKQEIVLSKMLELKFISYDEYMEAVNQKLVFSGKEKVQEQKTYRSYFTEALVEEVKRDLMIERKIPEAAANKLIYNNGLKIYATVDTKLQSHMEEVFYNTKNFPKLKGDVQPQSAMVVVNQHTGAVVGLIGGVGEKPGDLIFNRAVSSSRSPASSIKPIAIYAPAIEKNVISPASVFVDEPLKFNDWEPKNYDNAFKGAMTVRDAVIDSRNIPAILVGRLLGSDTIFSFLTEKLGLSTLDPVKDKNLSALALGGMERGVTVKDMAAAYAALANNGQYTKPYTYTKVLDQNNKVLLEKRKATEQVFSPQTAYLMTSILKSTAEGHLGRPALLSSGMPSAGKTGTSSDEKDRWYIGYTPYYTAAVWYGYDMPAPMPYSVTGFTAHKLWKTIMEELHKNLTKKDFEKPGGIEKATVCKYSGKLPLSSCPVVTDEFKSSNIPKTRCDARHKGVPVATPTSSADPNASPDPNASADPNATGAPAQTGDPLITNQPDSKTPVPMTQPPATKPPEVATPKPAVTPASNPNNNAA